MAILVTCSTLCRHLPSFSPSMLALLSPSLVSLELVYIHSCTEFRHISVLTSHHALVAIPQVHQTQLVKPYRGRTACAKESISCQCQWGNPGHSRSRCGSGVSEHNQSFYRLLPSAEECCPTCTWHRHSH
ncbi:hypothetical protein BGW80DRAFT_470023 [Lactifluus volemus]|nr:hypothetical protein BGW80DRAFT_470023 [Lactifluus volemus]